MLGKSTTTLINRKLGLKICFKYSISSFNKAATRSSKIDMIFRFSHNTSRSNSRGNLPEKASLLAYTFLKCLSCKDQNMGWNYLSVMLAAVKWGCVAACQSVSLTVSTKPTIVNYITAGPHVFRLRFSLVIVLKLTPKIYWIWEIYSENCWNY